MNAETFTLCWRAQIIGSAQSVPSNGKSLMRLSKAKQVAVRPAIALLILHRLVREIVGIAFHVPARDGVAQTTTPTAHRIHVFGEVEQVRSDTADLAQVRKGVSLRLRVAVRHDEREGEDRRIVLRRATSITDFNDAIHGANTISLDATHDGVVVLLHEIAFGDVKYVPPSAPRIRNRSKRVQSSTAHE